jgi:hypothetical protein
MIDLRTLGILLIFFHKSIGIWIAYHILTLDERKWKWLLPLMSGILTLQYCNRGCVLTRYERRLTGWNYTTIDPLLWLSNLPPTKENRYRVTINFTTFAVLYIILRMLTMYQPEYISAIRFTFGRIYFLTF